MVEMTYKSYYSLTRAVIYETLEERVYKKERGLHMFEMTGTLIIVIAIVAVLAIVIRIIKRRKK